MHKELAAPALVSECTSFLLEEGGVMQFLYDDEMHTPLRAAIDEMSVEWGVGGAEDPMLQAIATTGDGDGPVLGVLHGGVRLPNGSVAWRRVGELRRGRNLKIDVTPSRVFLRVEPRAPEPPKSAGPDEVRENPEGICHRGKTRVDCPSRRRPDGC